MTVQQMIELLQKQRPTKRVYISTGGACVEMKEENMIDLPWGITIR
jgi:hypothetical protein